MRFFFLQTCYNILDMTKTSTPCAQGGRRLLFSPKPMLLGIRLMLHWEEMTEDELFQRSLDGMLKNSKLDMLQVVRNAKVLSYLRACKINSSNLFASYRANMYRWFERDKDVEIVKYAAKIAPTLFRETFFKTFYQEYRHVEQEHNISHYIQFAYSYSQKAPENAGAEGGNQGPGS